MKVQYAVPWIEIEYSWGPRPEGYKIFDDLKSCIETTKLDSENGNYSNGGGYCGPERPSYYYEVPYMEDVPNESFVKILKFKSNPILIK